VLIDLVSGKCIEQVQSLDVDELFERLRLGEHLSPNRHFGVYAIVELMKQQASELSGNGDRESA
jgi:cysteine desulfuration protein SufE